MLVWNKKEIKTIKKIQKLLNEAHKEYEKLEVSSKEDIRQFHNEKSSLPYCLRWGLNACEELLEAEEDD
jgi:hypothetical protein